MRLEETLGRLEALAADADDAAVGQGIRLDQHGRLLAQALVEHQVVRDVAQLLLDLPDRLEVGGPVERVAALQQQGDQVAGDVPAGDVEPPGEVVQHRALVHGHDVCDAVAGVDDHARRQTLRVQREDGLDGDVHAAEAVPLEHDLAHLLPVLERVHRRLGQEDLGAGRVDAHLLVEGVVPQQLHVVPAFDDAVFHLCVHALAAQWIGFLIGVI